MLLVDKPAGPTSHDVVAGLRRATGQPRVGHTGTLDPPATGLLVVLLGAATRLAAYVPAAPKTYEGTFRLGVTTLTDDLTGDVQHRHEGSLPTGERVREEAARLTGRGWQIPPAISARQVGGRRLYRAARKGIKLPAPPSPIEVRDLEIAPTLDTALWSFTVSVSSGTYVRGLVRDLGAALGCGAAVASLRRTRIGSLDVADAVDADGRLEGLQGRLIGLDAIPLDLPSVTLPDEAAAGFRHGRLSPTEAPDGPVSVRDGLGALLGIGAATGGRLGPRVVLERSRRLPSVAGVGAAVITSGRSSS
jgi:tRNA pseudouridine55 synthase